MIASLTSQLIESEAAILVSLQLKESEAMIASLTSQLNEFKDKLSHSSSLNQQLEKQLQGTDANNASLTSQLNEFKDKLSLSSSQLNEARNQLSEVLLQIHSIKDCEQP
jgi:septal ring factor EnvC (AmiA/AmiB activator)